MKLANLVLITLINLLLFSCSNSMDKSVFEPMTLDELKTNIEKDTLFEKTYEYIERSRDSVLITDVQRAKYSDLTYKRVHNLVKFYFDTSRIKPIEKEIVIEWKDKFGSLHYKVDSISDVWKRFIDSNSLNKYVKIDLVQIKKSYYTYYEGLREVSLGFRLTPLEGRIEQVRFSFKFEPKINETERQPQYNKSSFDFDKSSCLLTTPFDKPVTRYWVASFSDKRILASKTLETLNRDYNVIINVDRVRINSENFENDLNEIPEVIRTYWRFEYNEQLKELYIEKVLKDLLDIEYIPEYKYINNRTNKIIKKEDPHAYEFLLEPSLTHGPTF